MLSRLLTRKEQYVLLVFAGSIALGAVALIVMGGQPRANSEGIELALPEAPPPADPLPQEPQDHFSEGEVRPRSDPEPEAPSGLIEVAITGAVHAPGVYTFHATDRVQTALRRAGGALPEADLSDINLAARLMDGSPLYIPVGRSVRVEEGRISVRSGTNAPGVVAPHYTISGWRPEYEFGPGGGRIEDNRASGGRLNVNQASADELATLPGIGPVLSENIVRHRQQQPFSSVEELIQVHGIGEKRLETLRPLVRVR